MITNFNNLADRLKGITFEGEEITAEKLMELHNSDTEVELGISEGVYLPNEKLIELTYTEFELLTMLIKSRGKVLTRDYL